MNGLVIHNACIYTLNQNEVIKNGYLLIRAGKITGIGAGTPPHNSPGQWLDANEMIVMPGLVDCHTHLMEYATLEVHHTKGTAQEMAGIANLLTALKSGIVALGEHYLGHPELIQQFPQYIEVMKSVPMDIKLASGCCFIGTDPLVFVSSTDCGQIISKKDLTPEKIKSMAERSGFPGENIFLNATVANLPPEVAPRAGEMTFTYEETKQFVDIFHSNHRKIGAHLEGDEAAEIFLEAGGDVICHGHNLSSPIVDKIADKKIPVVITPHGGTSAQPTSPAEVYRFYKKGVNVAIASDSYLPVHPEAYWIDIPAGELAGPEDFMTVAKPVLDHLLLNKVSVSEALRLITLNGRDIMGLSKKSGSIKVGNDADLIVSEGIPVIETQDVNDIKYVIKKGEIVIAKKS